MDRGLRDGLRKLTLHRVIKPRPSPKENKLDEDTPSCPKDKDALVLQAS